MSRCLIVRLVAAAIAVACTPTLLAAQASYMLTISDHRFSPETLTVPANAAFDLTVVNADSTAEEFESNDFHVEKVIGGGKQMTFHIGPLTPGEYEFFGERHMDTALGRLFAE